MTNAAPEPSPRDERKVADAFAAFRDGHRASFPAPPIETVYAEARRQQQRRHYRGGFAAAAALVLVVATLGLLNLVGSDQRQPTAEDHASASAAPSESVAPSDSPEPRPSGGTKTRDPGKPNPPRGVDLANATIELTSLSGCGGGAMTFSGGQATDPGGCTWHIGYAHPRYANLDGGSGQEIVTTVSASGTTGVVALRVPAKGSLTTMGYVVVAEPGTQTIESVSVSGGVVNVAISDTSYDSASPQRQTRGYRWATSAGAFVQVEGPTEFPSPDPQPSEPEPSVSPSGGE